MAQLCSNSGTTAGCNPATQQSFSRWFDSLSEGEIIQFSRVSKSEAGSIPQATGLDRSVRGTPGAARLYSLIFAQLAFWCICALMCNSAPALYTNPSVIRRLQHDRTGTVAEARPSPVLPLLTSFNWKYSQKTTNHNLWISNWLTICVINII